MKKILFLIGCTIIFIMSSCAKKESEITVDNVKKTVVSEILSESMMVGFSGASSAPSSKSNAISRTIADKSSNSFTIPINNTVNDNYGIGSVTINGNISGTLNTDGSAVEKFTFAEVYNNFAISCENKTYKCSGNVNYVGDFTITSTQSYSFTSTIYGTLAITGTGYNSTSKFDITCKSSGNSSSSSITVTGTIDGENVSFAY